MSDNIHQNPEQIARDRIDKMLTDAQWVVQSVNIVDLSATLAKLMVNRIFHPMMRL